MKMSRYGIKAGYRPSPYSEPQNDMPRRKRSFRNWLRNYLSYNNEPIHEVVSAAVSTDTFNKSFEGWQIRLHKANGGHIVEAWKNEDTGPTNNYRRPHELFFVSDSSDMGSSLNDILVQLMLRG